MQTVTSASIRERISSLEIARAGTEAEFDRLASAAIDGDAEAGRAAAEADTRLSRMAVDARILSRALDRSLKAEAAAAEADAAVVRRAHRANARTSAARLLDLARQIDAATAAMLPLLREIEATEREIGGSLRLAGSPPSGGVVGQRDLAVIAMDRLTLSANGRVMFSSDQRPVAEIARTAWRDLLTNDEDEAA